MPPRFPTRSHNAQPAAVYRCHDCAKNGFVQKTLLLSQATIYQGWYLCAPCAAIRGVS